MANPIFRTPPTRIIVLDSDDTDWCMTLRVHGFRITGDQIMWPCRIVEYPVCVQIEQWDLP